MTPPQTRLFLSAWCRCRVGQTQEYFRCADSHLDSLMTTKNVLLHNVYFLNYQHYVLNSQSHGTVATSRNGYKNLRESPGTKLPQDNKSDFSEEESGSVPGLSCPVPSLAHPWSKQPLFCENFVKSKPW